VRVEVRNIQSLPIKVGRLKQLADFVLKKEGVRDGYISIALVDDQRIKEINRVYAKIEKPTDVLSFDLSEKDYFIGDIIISVETAQRKAKEVDWSLEKEVGLYLVHGILHLVGYDDQKKKDYLRMKKREEEIVRDFFKEEGD